MEIQLAPGARAEWLRDESTGEIPDADGLYDLYTRHFTTVRADTEQLRAQFYRLRYQVYCVENSFEDPAQQDGGMEHDEFDDHSSCSILIHKPTGIIAGGIGAWSDALKRPCIPFWLM